MSSFPLMEIAIYLPLGVALGGIYFLLLLQTARLHAANAALMRLAPLYALRLALAITAFWLVAQKGALPLVLTLGGFLLGRFVVQRRLGSG